MSKKKFWIILIAGIILIYIILNYLDIYIMKTMEKSDEEYVAILINNKEDFDYVAEMMQQWPDRSIIYLKNDISSESLEITSELSLNKEFYTHLKNLNDLKVIDEIVKRSDEVEFCFSRPPQNYHGGFYYGKDIKENMTVHRIDKYWVMKMIPNV